MKPPPPPPSPYRRAALAARVGPAAAGVRIGILSRVPGFGIRQRRRRRAEAQALKKSENGGSGLDGLNGLNESGDQSPPRGELEEATKRILVEVGGDFREETVLAAAVIVRDDDDEVSLVSPVDDRGGREEEDKEGKMVELHAKLKAKGKVPQEKKEKKKSPHKNGKPCFEETAVDDKVAKKNDEKWKAGEANKGRMEEVKNEISSLSMSVAMAEKELLLVNENEDVLLQRLQKETLETPPFTATTILTGDSSTPSEEKVYSTTTEINSPTGIAATKKVKAPSISKSRRKSEEIRERRAEIKRLRAARRIELGGALSPLDRVVSMILRSLRRSLNSRPTGRARRPLRAPPSPEQEDMVRRVCALSRPPAKDCVVSD